jgi:hypothetical protein
VVKAFRNAGATEEMIAGARLIYGSLPSEPRGRTRIHKTPKEANHAYYWRHRDRILKTEANRRKNRKHRAFDEEDRRNARAPAEITNGEDTHVLTLDEAKAIHTSVRRLAGYSLKDMLVDAAGGNVDREADVLTIRALIENKDCDLEADVLPTVARLVPELPRPLRNWGAQWLIEEILAARDKRGAAHEPPREPPEPLERPEPPSYATPDLLAAVTFQEPPEPVEAPPPARRVSAFDWDEFVAGHRAGLIEWNTARLSPGRGGQGSARRRRELDLERPR